MDTPCGREGSEGGCASLYKTFTTVLAGEGKQANRASPAGNAPLLPPSAASPPEGEILAALYNERLKLALR